jgi:hypothetical protein
VRTILIAATALVLALATAALSAPGTASGTVTKNGKSFAVAHAWAIREAGSDVVQVILAKETVAADVLNDMKKMNDLAKAGSFHALVLRLEPDGKILSFGIYDPSDGFFQSNGDGQSFVAKTFDGKTVAGKAATAARGEMFGRSWEYAVTFSAAIGAGGRY